eukprot:4153213-Amphidinium_carterae.1
MAINGNCSSSTLFARTVFHCADMVYKLRLAAVMLILFNGLLSTNHVKQRPYIMFIARGYHCKDHKVYVRPNLVSEIQPQLLDIKE